MNGLPVNVTWDGECFRPLPGYNTKRCNAEFVVGERYALAEWQDRSMMSHNHQFAWLKDAWLNLPEWRQDQFPTPTHLRKHALIATGWRDIVVHSCETEAEAIRIAAICKGYDDYCIVHRAKNVVQVLTAKSQKMSGRQAMNKAEFQQSKTDILEYIARMIDVTPEELEANGGKAA